MPHPSTNMCHAAGTVLIWVSWASCTYHIAPQVLNLTLMGEAAEHDVSKSNGTRNETSVDSESSNNSFDPTPVGPQVDLDAISIVAKGGDEEASSNGGPTPMGVIARARRPSYSRLAAPSAVRPSSRPRTRRSSAQNLGYGRARVEATGSSSSVPAQRSNPLDPAEE